VKRRTFEVVGKNNAERTVEIIRDDGGFNAIMVVTDVLTKYVVVSALRDKTAAEVGQAFWNDYVCHYLFPKMVQTDRGKEFTLDLAQAFFRAAVDKVQSTAYHPQSQGVVERFNRMMTDMLAIGLSVGFRLENRFWCGPSRPRRTRTKRSIASSCVAGRGHTWCLVRWMEKMSILVVSFIFQKHIFSCHFLIYTREKIKKNMNVKYF
jgi:hypothetical protein